MENHTIATILIALIGAVMLVAALPTIKTQQDKWILNEVSTAENIEIDSELIKTK